MTQNTDDEYRNLKTKIDRLSNFPELELAKIVENKEISSIYSEVLEYLLESKKDPEKEKKIKRVISKLYFLTEISPNTIGSFIFGCRQTDYGDMDKYCSVLCLNSLINPKKAKCGHNVILQINSDTEDRFIFKNNTDSDKCYVYTMENFKGFYAYEIDKLHTKRIKSVQILSTKNSKHFKHTDFVPLSSIPKISISKNSDDEQKEIINRNEAIVIIVVVIVLIIIILCLIYLNREN